jgi:hypothetical protein
MNSQHLADIMTWFKLIKTFDGKKPNTIAYN